MENQTTLNPDRRRLPDGWVQHYQPATQMWYYIQTVVAPPTVSFIHPAEGTVNRASSPTAAGPQFHNQTMRSPNGHTTSPGMTVAQKLYASSGIAAAPMINTNSITSLSTSVDAASTPSPPPASNRLSTPTSTSPLRSESSRAMNYLPQLRVSLQGSRINPHNSNRPRAALYASAQSSVPSNNMGDHNPHRAATEPPTTTINIVRERSHSQNAGSETPNSLTSIPRPRPTPNLVTKARPPPLDISLQPGRVDFATSPHPLSVPPTTPPSSSLLFSNPTESLSLSSYNRPGSGTSTITPHSAHVYNNFGLDQQINQVGRMDATLDTTAGDLDPARLLSMLKIALSVNPIAESELRSVAYTQPNANYQSVVNALKYQQRLRTLPSGVGLQHHSPVDYQLLITEVERLEVKATLALQSQQAIIAQQQQMALDAHRKQQEATLAQQRLSILNQQAQEQAILNSNLQHQNTIFAQQQALLHQRAKEEAMVKLQIQQQQQAAFSQQQVAMNQAQEQALLNMQIQQQNHAAIAHQQAILNHKAEEQAALQLQLQQQALMQANQQQLHALQQQQMVAQRPPVNHSQPHQPTAHQWGQQQQQQSGLGTFISSVMGGGPQQQTSGQGNPSIQQHVVSHLFDSVVNSLQGPGASDPCGATGGDAGNQGLMTSITQGLNAFSGGSQDPSSGLSGLLGGTGNVDFTTMVSGSTDLSNLTASVDFSSGVDFNSDDC